MRLSETKCTELYAAIAGPIMEERTRLLRFHGHNEMDEKLFKLQNEIWRRVHRALKLDCPA